MGTVPTRSWLPDELPRIRGTGWWAYLPIWLGLFVAAAIGTAVPLWEAWRREGVVSPTGATGIDLRTDIVDRAVIAYPQTDEAARAGIARGQRIVAVDGRNVDRRADVIDALRGETGTVARVATVAPDGRRAEHRLTRDPDHLRESYRKAQLRRGIVFATSIIGLYIGTGLLPLLCGALLLARRTKDRFAPWASLALLCSSLGFGPSVGWFGGYSETSAAYLILNGSATVTLLLMLILFPDGRFTSRKVKVLSFVTIAVVLATPIASSFVLTNASLAAGMIISVFVMADRMKRSAASREVQQIRWVLFGFAAAALALVLYTAAATIREQAPSIEVAIWAILAENLFGGALSAILLAAITIGLLRYRLYDADATISRSVAYGSITILLLGVFAGSQKVVELLGEEYLGESLGAPAGVLGAAMAAICIVPINRRVARWAERRFQGDLFHLRQGLPLLVGDLRETASPAALADALLHRIEHGVRAAHGAVVAGGRVIAAWDIDADAARAWLTMHGERPAGAGRLDTDRADRIFPMRVSLQADGVGQVGFLLLGPRPDGSFYGKDERDTLAAIADPVARALSIAIERERHEAERRLRETAAHRTLDALCRFVHERFGVDVRTAASPAVPGHSTVALDGVGRA